MLVRHSLSLIFFLVGQGVAQQPEESALVSQRQTEGEVELDSESGHSGTIYVVRHAETSKAKSPYGINEKGLRRARHLQQIFDGSKFEEPKSIIAGQVKGNRQRMQDTVTPLAKHLGIHIDTSVGPLVDDPHWTEAPCKDAARKAKAALSRGPVLIGWWSYIEYLCKDLGASRCPGGVTDFKGFDQVLVVEMKNGRVDSMKLDAQHFNQVDGQFEGEVEEEVNEEKEVEITLPWLTDGCSNRGDCGIAYQSCCLGFQVKGFPCGCKLADGGSGVSKGDCGDCGAAYTLCCAGFAAKGFGCTCDVSDGGAVV